MRRLGSASSGGSGGALEEGRGEAAGSASGREGGHPFVNLQVCESTGVYAAFLSGLIMAWMNPDLWPF